MHDLSLIFGMYEKCDLLFKQIGIIGKDVLWKVFYIVLNVYRLTLGIGNLMSSHSLSAGHVPLGLGRDKKCVL